jgi:O-antigen/teichoic acid export membrane protein
VHGIGVTGELLILPFAVMLSALTANEVYRRLALFARAVRFVWLLDILRFVGLGLILAWGAGEPGSRLASFTMLQITVAYAVALGLVTLLFLPRIGSLTTLSAHQARRILSAGRWLSISALLQLLHDNVFLVVGSVVAGMEAVGIVRACQTLVGTIHPFVLVLEHIFPRQIGQSVREYGWRVALTDHARLAGIAVGGIILVLALLAALAEPLLVLALGPGADAHAWVMRGVCLVWVPLLTFTATTFPLRALEQTAPIAASLAISAILAVVISVPIIQMAGVAGMVAGQVIVNVVATTLLGLQYARIWKKRVGG